MKTKSSNVKSSLLLALIAAVVLLILNYIVIRIPAANVAFWLSLFKGVCVMVIVALVYHCAIAKTSPKILYVVLLCILAGLLMACVNRMISSSPAILSGRFLKMLGLSARYFRHAYNVICMIGNFVCAFVGFVLIGSIAKGGFKVGSIQNADSLLEQILSGVQLQLEQPKYAQMCSAEELNVTQEGELYTITGYVEDNGTKKFFRATAKYVQKNWIVIDAKL